MVDLWGEIWTIFSVHACSTVLCFFLGGGGAATGLYRTSSLWPLNLTIRLPCPIFSIGPTRPPTNHRNKMGIGYRNDQRETHQVYTILVLIQNLARKEPEAVLRQLGTRNGGREIRPI